MSDPKFIIKNVDISNKFERSKGQGGNIKVLYIVTIKKYNKSHNPRDKKTGPCITSGICTDKTGHHHSVMVRASSIQEVQDKINNTDMYNYHITRIEEANVVID